MLRSHADSSLFFGVPFTETSSDLFAIDSKVIMADQVVQSIKEAEGLGRKQYEAFVDEKIVKMTRNIHDAIPKNKLALFTSGQRKTTSKSKAKLSSMKSDLGLFSRMYISCPAREGEMNAFFEHENHAWPPSLAENDSMRHGNKADFLKCLEPLVQHTQMAPEVDVKLFDGAALVHKLEPKKAITLVNTFKDYADIVFIPYLLKQLQLVRRVDVVWDSYAAHSLKAHTRQCRGTGSPLRVTEKTRIPG